ncbi:MAG TPA: PHP domain-containing protein [Clostridiales bacterium]|nr:PHP domain-containing protein [Clostridiales bacterium]
MTPNNIVNMALLNGLDSIAVTDHNSCDNVEAVIKAAGDRIIVIPGMELQTLEEVHLLCYFKDLSSLYSFRDQMEKYYDGMPNNPAIFGNQLVMNEHDEIIGEKEQLLLTSLSITFDEAVKMVRKHKGLPVPAHINKPSYSLLSQLGFIPSYLDLTLLEFSQNYHIDFDAYQNYRFITSSDAHFLGHILDRKMAISVEELTISGIFDSLAGSHI